MFRKAFFYIALIASLIQPANVLLTYTAWSVNHEYIARTLCVNRNRPERCCEGKCYLSKQLEKHDDTQNTPFQVREGQFSSFYVRGHAPVLSIAVQAVFRLYPLAVSAVVERPLSSVFHPPCLSPLT